MTQSSVAPGNLTAKPAAPRQLAGVLQLALAALLIVVPPLLSEGVFFLHLGVLIFLNVIIVLGLYLVSRAGQLPLCHAAFVGFGAYCSALTVKDLGVTPLVGLVVASLLTALAALAIGAVTLRLRGVYFVLVTFLFGQVFNLLLLDAAQITGGANGVVGIPSISLIGFRLTNAFRFYWFAAAIAVLVALAISAFLRRSPGRALASIEENIVLAESGGIDTQRYQRLAFVLGSAVAGLGGGMFAHYIRFVSPDSFTFWDSVTYIVMLVVGGRASIAGPIIGAVLLTLLPELLRGAESYQHLLYGLILIVILKVRPDGLITLGALLRGRRGAAALR